MKEIERKFIVNKEVWSKTIKPKPIKIKQGYISKAENGVVRVRTKNEKAYLTIKSANFGIERYEFEYEIPLIEANKIFEVFCDSYIEKNRYEIVFGNKIWEIDEFVSPVQHFILAEIELNHSLEEFEKPEWVQEEVSNNPLYFNSNLI